MGDFNLRAAIKALLRWLSLFYLLGLAFVLLALRWWGEGSIYTGPALLFPAYVWLLPGVVLALLTLVIDLSMAAILGFVLIWAGWSYVGFHANRALPREVGDLTVVSCNLGRITSARTLQPFVRQQNPDVIAIQEAYGRNVDLSRQFPDYEARGLDQFPFLSRFPIVEARVVELREGQRREPYAARFVIDFHGRQVAIYNVHLPTPRSLLAELREKPRLLQPLGLGPEDRERRRRQREQWALRARQIRELAAILKDEELPMIVVGDFNTPPRGMGYPLFTAFLQDAFAEGGRGFGWTFPCDRRGALETFAPWLRIDYQFASDEWRVSEAMVESKRRSQHLATAARYRWK